MNAPPRALPTSPRAGKLSPESAPHGGDRNCRCSAFKFELAEMDDAIVDSNRQFKLCDLSHNSTKGLDQIDTPEAPEERP